MAEAIIFDFDGVLADTVQAHTSARIQAFEDLGYDVEPTLHTLAHRHGSHPPEIIGWILQQAGLVKQGADIMTNEIVKNVVRRKSEIYFKEATAGLNIVKGVLDFIEWATQEHSSDGLAIATTASTALEVNPYLRRHGLEGIFKVIVGSELVLRANARMKPDPFVYNLTISKLGIDPGMAVAIEDSPRGVQAAKSAGLIVVGITTTHSSHDLIESDFVVKSFKEIEEIIM